MKRKLIKIITCLSILLSLSCSSDSSNNELELNEMYIKSYKTVNAPSPGFYDAFFEYKNGYLINGTGFNAMGGTFQYDSSGKLITRQTGDKIYSYLYDNQGRLIKQLRNGTNDNITLTYDSNKITITESYDFINGRSIEVSEIYLDNKSQIIKVKRITPSSSYEYMLQEYSYDDNGNITQLSYKENTNLDPDLIIKYEYDNKKNPFYTAFKKLYKSIYYLECRKGIPNYKHMGITPNNMTVYGSSTYDHKYNDKGYPIQWITTYENGGSVPAKTLRTIEYY